MTSHKYNLFFNNLSNKLKIDIILSLKENSKSVTELSKKLKIEQSKISHALSSLRDCSIVNAEQKGKQRIYSLNKKTIIPMLNLIDRHAHNFCRGNCKKYERAYLK